MPRFSERQNLRAARSVIQADGLDQDTRSRLWNSYIEYVRHWAKSASRNSSRIPSSFLSDFCQNVWDEIFHLPADKISSHNVEKCIDDLRRNFIEGEWHLVYDLVEHAADVLDDDFPEQINKILETHLAGFRFVKGTLQRLTSEEEIATIEVALNAAHGKPFQQHLEAALKLFSDKTKPDYRNSIKESISAVEAVCKEISGKPNATLGEALNHLEKSGPKIHGALKNSFSSLYGWTSDSNGIRHALMEAPNIDQADAKYVLIACSSFINWLVSKDQ